MFRWRLYLALLVHDLLHATSCLSTTPLDRVALVNSSTSFECGSNRSVMWSFRRTGQLADKRIFSVGQQPSDPRHSLDRSRDDQHDLVISDVRLSDSGLYTCIDNDGFGPAASAKLVVLESLPICDANVTASQPVIESQIIELRCSFVYAGQPQPRVHWTSPTTGTVNSSTSSTRQIVSDVTTIRLESWVVVVAAAEGVGPYRYTVSTFDDDRREPMFMWNSSSPVVLYAVRNVVVNKSDDEDVVLGETLQCRARGFPPAQYRWRNAGTGQTFTGPNLQLDAEGQHTYECIATNVVANVTHTERARITLLVTRPSTTKKSRTKFAVSVTAAVLIATGTAIIAVFIVCCAFLVFRLFAANRRRQRTTLSSSSSSSSDSGAVVVIRPQVRVSPPQDAAGAFHDSSSSGRKLDPVSGLYDSIDEQSVGYEELSTAQQSAAAASPGALARRLSFPRRDATAVDVARRTPAENDYLLICSESDGQAERRLQGQSDVGVRHDQPPQSAKDDGLYVNGAASTPAARVVALSDVGVYIHTLADD